MIGSSLLTTGHRLLTTDYFLAVYCVLCTVNCELFMDEISSFNQSSWDELVRRGVMYARPFLNLTSKMARLFLDSVGTLLGDITGLEVLCLASAKITYRPDLLAVITPKAGR
jgi:hypothetical protein